MTKDLAIALTIAITGTLILWFLAVVLHELVTIYGVRITIPIVAILFIVYDGYQKGIGG